MAGWHQHESSGRGGAAASESICPTDPQLQAHKTRQALTGRASLNPASHPPASGANWIHETSTTGFRLLEGANPVGNIRLITRGGNDWMQGYPLVAEAVNQGGERKAPPRRGSEFGI
jgi:ATP-dependent DNA ligase